MLNTITKGGLRIVGWKILRKVGVGSSEEEKDVKIVDFFFLFLTSSLSFSTSAAYWQMPAGRKLLKFDL